MRKLFIHLAIFIAALTWLHTFSTQAQELHVENSLFWQISGNGMQDTSYVFGTIHIICEQDFVEFEILEQKMYRTQQLVLELDMEDPMIMFTLMQNMLMDDGTVLPDLLSRKQYRMVKQFFKDSLQAELPTMHNIKPFFLLTMLMPQMLSCQTRSYDMYLLGLSKEVDIPVIGLETVEEQIEVFNHLSYEDQAKMLVEALQDYDKGRSDFMNMVQYYLKMDMEGMLEYSSSMETEYEAFNYALLEERNVRWIPRMTDLMKDAPTFFGVGAGHLPGEKGIINLLRQAGYRVEPLM